MKKVFLILSLVMTVMAAMAVPAKRGIWKTLTLSDGTEVKATLVGDEHGHFWRAEDGTAYMQVIDTEVYQQVDAEAVMARAKMRRQSVNVSRTKRMAARRVGEVGSFTGNKKAIMILVNFSTTSFSASNNQTLFNRIANEENFSSGKFKGSMADYFKAQSRGKFELDFDVVGPVTVSKNRTYYGSNDSQGNDKYPGTMVCEAVTLAKDLVSDWSQYDWDGDGEVDQVYLVYAGKGEADGGAASTIWPHAYTLQEAQQYGDGTGPVTVGTNLVVNSYACGPELDGQTGSVSGIGTMCHEYSHCLGYPDFYDIDYSGGQGMGSWDLMDSGSYNGDGYQPAGYTSYERWVAGWLDPIVLDEEDVKVENMKSLQNDGESYVIYNKGNANEYFLLENRQLEGWDASLPAAGLLILHCDYKASVWAENEPNDDPNHQRMTVVPADGRYNRKYDYSYQMYYYEDSDIQGDPFPNKTINAFNRDFTTYDNIAKRAAQFYNKNTDGTYWLDSSVEGITQNSDKTVNFNFVASYGSSSQGGEEPVTPTDDYLFYESFDNCDGTGGNDGKWSGIVSSPELITDNKGWTAVEDKGFSANSCARFGTGKVDGSATTPAIAVNGTATLTFNAGAWNATNDGTTLNLSVTDGTIDKSSVTMTKGAFTSYTATVTGTGSVKITFAAEKGRFFLDEVLVKQKNTETAIKTINAVSPRVSAVYALDGRHVGNDFNALPRGLYIVNGKKVIK